MIIDLGNKLGQLHEKARPIFSKFVTEVQAAGYNIKVKGVIYTLSDGLRLNEEDKRNPIWSYHTFGFAVDMNIVNVDTNKTYFKITPLDEWQKTGIPKIAENCGLTWGGTAYLHYYDPIHFEYRYIDFPALKEAGLQQFGQNESAKYNKVKL